MRSLMRQSWWMMRTRTQTSHRVGTVVCVCVWEPELQQQRVNGGSVATWPVLCKGCPLRSVCSLAPALLCSASLAPAGDAEDDETGEGEEAGSSEGEISDTNAPYAEAADAQPAGGSRRGEQQQQQQLPCPA